MARAKIALLVMLLMLISFQAATAQDTTPSGLLVYNVWVRPTAPALVDGTTPEPPIPGTVTGAYMTIENSSDSDYKLVGVSDDFAEMSMLHQMSVDSKGVMRMQMIDQLDIPAGQTVTLEPAAYHVMLMNVAHDLYPGQAVALTLTFADSNGATFEMPVGAIVTDDPPKDDPLIVANATAQADASNPTALDVTLIVDNGGDQGDTLTGASSDAANTTTLMHFEQAGIMPFESIYLPPKTQTTLSTETAFIRLSDVTQPLPDAFPLTLTFQSGKTITAAVPVIEAGS